MKQSLSLTLRRVRSSLRTDVNTGSRYVQASQAQAMGGKVGGAPAAYYCTAAATVIVQPPKGCGLTAG